MSACVCVCVRVCVSVCVSVCVRVWWVTYESVSKYSCMVRYVMYCCPSNFIMVRVINKAVNGPLEDVIKAIARGRLQMTSRKNNKICRFLALPPPLSITF